MTRRRRPPSRLERFKRWLKQPASVAGAAVFAVSIAALGTLSFQVQQRASHEAAEVAKSFNGVATDEMLANASECTRRYLKMNYTRNDLVVMADDVRTLEQSCAGMERHKAMLEAQREALSDHPKHAEQPEGDQTLAQGQPASAPAH
jgi:hypothetical protein